MKDYKPKLYWIFGIQFIILGTGAIIVSHSPLVIVYGCICNVFGLFLIIDDLGGVGLWHRLIGKLQSSLGSVKNG